MPTDDEDTHDATSPTHSEDNVNDNGNASSPSQSASGSGSDNSDSDNSEDEVEWLVTSRAKRATAGNRLNALLQQEEEKEGDEDELELLFAEADDDAGFESDAAADSDVQMDSSSSDDEDAGADNDDDNLAGERELRRAERAEKQASKKRKATDGIPAIFKKRVKIDPTAVVQRKPSSLHPGRVAPSAAAPRPKKKSERASWIPTQEDAPTRASARGTTRASKETLHAQMIDREVKRLRQLANMEKAAAAKEAAKKPAMTQADRLAEAARVEKSNAKSLSRWEEAEQAREEEQRAKLAALSNRQLEGPVITWWSGVGEWTGGVLRKVGKNLKVDEPKEKGTKKRKAAEMDGEKNDGEKAEGGKPHEEKPEGQKVEGENPEGEKPAEAQQTAGGTEGETTKKTGDSEMTADGPEKARQTEEKTVDVPENAAQTEQRTMDITENAPQTEEKSDESTEEAPQQPSTDTQLLSGTELAGKPEDTGKSDQESVGKPPGAELQNPESSPEESEPATNQEGEGKEEEGNQGAGKEQEKPVPENTSAKESKPEAETEPAPSPPKPQSEPAPGPKDPSPQPPSDPSAPPPAPAPSQTPSHPPFILAPPPGFPPAPATLDGSTPLPGLGFTPTIPPTGPLAHAAPSQLNQQKQDGQQGGQENQQSGSKNQPQENQQENQQQPPDGSPAPPPVTEKGTVNLLILANFDEFAIKNKDVQTQVLFNRKFPKAPKHKREQALCAITSYPARYRDPATGLAYCNSYAYREIQRLQRGEYRWSKLVGAYVGQGTYAARGVPARFLTGASADEGGAASGAGASAEAAEGQAEKKGVAVGV